MVVKNKYCKNRFSLRCSLKKSGQDFTWGFLTTKIARFKVWSWWGSDTEKCIQSFRYYGRVDLKYTEGLFSQF